MVITLMTVPVKWIWTADRYSLAKRIAEGATYLESAAMVGLAENTVRHYMNEVPEFRAYVDKMTLENELVTRAGTIRALMRVAEEKQPDAREDKDTYLDYLKYIQELRKEEGTTDLELEVTFK